MTLERIGSGKVRELYDAGPGLLLLVALIGFRPTTLFSMTKFRTKGGC